MNIKERLVKIIFFFNFVKVSRLIFKPSALHKSVQSCFTLFAGTLRLITICKSIIFMFNFDKHKVQNLIYSNGELSRRWNHFSYWIEMCRDCHSYVTIRREWRKKRERERERERKVTGFLGAVLSRDEMPFHITSLCVAIMPLRRIHTGEDWRFCNLRGTFVCRPNKETCRDPHGKKRKREKEKRRALNLKRLISFSLKSFAIVR